MEIITIDDVQDLILNITEKDIAAANSFVTEAAARHGVAEADIIAGYLVKRLACVYACYSRAVASIGTDVMANMDGHRGADIYAQKAEYYQKEMNNISQKLTASGFTGGRRKGMVSIPMYRS